MKKTLSLVIPVYNEASRIEKCLTALKNWKVPRPLTIEEIIFVNDGSRDTTKRIIQRAKKSIEKNCKTKMTIISYAQNQGKGYAIARGMQASTSEYSVFLDADMATPISELTKFLPAMKANIDVIVGTRKNGKSTVLNHQPIYREVLGRTFTWLTNQLFGLQVTDFTCGFKAFRLSAKDAVFASLTAKRWAFDAEAIWRAHVLEYTMREVPVTWSDVSGSKVALWKDIPKTLAELVRARMLYQKKSWVSAQDAAITA